MRGRMGPLLIVVALAFAVGACGDDGGSVTTGGATTTGGGGSTLVTPGTIMVEALDRSWELPAAACLRLDGDAAAVAEAAASAADEAQSLVGRLVSGWPTTTWSSWASDTYAGDLEVAAVTALTLARLVGEQAAIEAAWRGYEQSYADPAAGWGGPAEIQGRLADWNAKADTLTTALAGQCAAG